MYATLPLYIVACVHVLAINAVLVEDGLRDRLSEVGWFLRGHKFHGFDARYFDGKGKSLEHEDIIGKESFMYQFPTPALRSYSFHEELKKKCEEGLLPCLDHVYKTAVEARKANGNKGAIDETSPFKNHYEKFQYRTTASYFLCWNTMKQHSNLKFFGKSCGDENERTGEQDYRGSDKTEFSCALFSFCPDPCCGKYQKQGSPMGILSKAEDCFKTSQNPCKGLANGQCETDSLNNMNFEDLIDNRINSTCDCATEKGVGYRWFAPAEQCVDVDECYEGTHHCKGDTICRNEVGQFRCACRLGYSLDQSSGQCLMTIDIDLPMNQQDVEPLFGEPVEKDNWSEWKDTILSYLGVNSSASSSFIGLSQWTTCVFGLWICVMLSIQLI